MPKIRIRVRLGRGTSGVPLDELGGVASEARNFLRSLSHDVGLPDADKWIAEAPRRGSFAFDLVYDDEVGTGTTRSVNARVKKLNAYKPGRQKAPQNVSRDTVIRYAKMASKIAEAERLELGVFGDPGARTPTQWGELSRSRSEAILSAMAEVVVFYGTIQGTIHNVNVGASPNFFQLRDVGDGSLVRCIFKPDLRQLVVDGLRQPGVVLLVSGHAKASREYETITEFEAERIEAVESISEADFERFVGSAPDLTGDLTTDEFIDRIRRDET